MLLDISQINPKQFANAMAKACLKTSSSNVFYVLQVAFEAENENIEKADPEYGWEEYSDMLRRIINLTEESFNE